MRASPLLLLLLIAALGVTGCGQKGPLYLPEAGAEVVPAQMPPAQPASGEAPGPDTPPEDEDTETRAQPPQ
jgi:predicted small lipoprotein YifL